MNDREPTGWRIGKLVIRIVLAVPLILAGVVKLADPLAFRRSLEAYGFFPAAAAVGLAVALPPFELLCGALLLIRFGRRAAALATAGLMLGFSCVTAISLWHGPPPECGCFGSLAWLNWPPPVTLARDLVLLALAVWLYREECKRT
jgi:uncharacterized membrane protein YphA (DoxX/SURF4 family)